MHLAWKMHVKHIQATYTSGYILLFGWQWECIWLPEFFLEILSIAFNFCTQLPYKV